VSLEGHFVVVMPESTRTQALIWDGLFGMRRESWKDMFKRMTGVVVLIADEPIEDVDEVMRMRAPLSRRIVCALGVLVLGLVLPVTCAVRLSRGRMHFHKRRKHDEGRFETAPVSDDRDGAGGPRVRATGAFVE
jgi:hypothetical protein